MTRRARVLIADDNAEWRGIIGQVIESECDVAGYVEHGDDVLAAALRLAPDVVTLDVSMPGQSGLQALPKLRKALPQAILIVISTSDNRVYREHAGKLGADGYVAKAAVMRDLMPAIRGGSKRALRNQRLA